MEIFSLNELMYIILLMHCSKFVFYGMKPQKPEEILASVPTYLCLSRRIGICQRIISQVFRKHLEPMGVTESQVSILFLIAKNIHLSQSVISQALFLEKSTVSRNMRRLIDQHLIRRKSNEISLTQKGKMLVSKLLPLWQAAMDESLELLHKEGDDSLMLVFEKLTHGANLEAA